MRNAVNSHLSRLENQKQGINQLKKSIVDIDEKIKKIALIKVFENISGCSGCNPIRGKDKIRAKFITM